MENLSMEYDWIDNGTNTSAESEDDVSLGLGMTVVTSVVLSLLILLTIVGNVSVIAAILRERALQTVGNSLVLSLAVADLLVACLVMPPGAVYEVTRAWTLGPALCDVWTACDVLCCTASILHLLAIATDRYWAVTNIDYVRRRSPVHVSLMIFLIWSMAAAVSVAPVLGWKDPDFWRRIHEEKKCLISQDAAYQLFATCASFYLPLILILFLYWRIYRFAKTRIRQKPGSQILPKLDKLSPTDTNTLTPYQTELTVISSAYSSHPSSDNTNNSCDSNPPNNNFTMKPIIPRKLGKHVRDVIKSKRERKAAKTLAIITGIFVICWLPFFVMALLMALCQTCEPDSLLFSFFLWLGYANSMLNPIIYTIFSPDFRNAFKRMLCNQHKSYQHHSIPNVRCSNTC